MQVDDIKNQALQNQRKTLIDKYGTPDFSKLGVEKRKITNKDKYGKEYPGQVKEFREKALKTKIENGTLGSTNSYCFNNECFDSSWELAFYIYHIDKGHKIDHEKFNFSYVYHNQKHLYFPDFKVNNRYYEIKGDQFLIRHKNGNIKGMICPFDHSKDDLYNAKYKCMKKHNVIIVNNKKIKKYLKYITVVYGSKYLDKFKINK